jgi:hypothetical protein
MSLTVGDVRGLNFKMSDDIALAFFGFSILARLCDFKIHNSQSSQYFFFAN